MKINTINFFKHNKNNNLKTFKTNKRTDFLKNVNFDTLNFKSSLNPKKDVHEIDKYVENKPLNEEIKEKLLIQEDGSYSRELEEDFILYFKLATNSIKNINSQYKKDALTKAVLETLRAVEIPKKPSDIEILTLIAQAYSAVLHNQTNVFEVYNICKDEDGKIDSEKANMIFLWQYGSYNQFSPYKIAELLDEYCRDKDNKISKDKSEMIPILFNCCNCNTDEECTKFTKLVLDDENDLKSDINLDKYQFLVSKMLKLYSISIEELEKNYNIDLNDIQKDDSYSQKAELSSIITFLSSEIIAKLMENSTDKDGKFNIEKAQQTFDFILKYAQDYRYSLNETKVFKVSNPNMGNLYRKEISLNELEGITAARYDNSVYRMHRILCEENIGQKYLH